MTSFLRDHINPDALHHAYVLAHGQMPREDVEKELFDFVGKTFGIKMARNPNVFRRTYENLGVDDVGELLSFSSYVALSDGQNVSQGGSLKMVCISMRAITHGAQNALLKMLEDPVGRTTFFILIPSRASLLPTFLSRVLLIDLAKTSADGSTERKGDPTVQKNANTEALDFLSAPLTKRLDLIKKILDQEEKDAVLLFIADVEKVVHGHAMQASPLMMTKEKVALLETIQTVDEYNHDTSASSKLMLEYLALKLPAIK